MKELNSFKDELLGQNNLQSQLQAGVSFSADNWNSIVNDLKDKGQLIQKIIDDLPDVKASDYSFNSSQLFKFSVTLFMAGTITLSATSKQSIK